MVVAKEMGEPLNMVIFQKHLLKVLKQLPLHNVMNTLVFPMAHFSSPACINTWTQLIGDGVTY